MSTFRLKYADINKNIKEADIQVEFVAWADSKTWGNLLVPVLNEFPFSWMYPKFRHAYRVKRLKMGMKKGASDLILFLPANDYHGCVIEVKRPGEKPRKEQLEFMDRMRNNGYYAFWADNLTDLKQNTNNYIEGKL